MKKHRVIIRRKNLSENEVDDIAETINYTDKSLAMGKVEQEKDAIKSNYVITYHKCTHDDENVEPCVIETNWEKD